MTDELPEKLNSSDTSDELTAIIPISDFKLSGINLVDFPVEDFFKVPFSHHITIFSKVSTIFSKVNNLQERYYYIHRVVEENLQVDTPVTSEEIKAVAERINRKLAEINGLDDEDSKDVKKKLKKAKRQIEKDYLPRKEKYEKADATFNDRNSYSKTDEDATFMRMKEDHMLNGQLKPEVLTTIMD